MTTYSPSTILRIKESLPLPALVADYFPLRKSGQQWLIACLWHRDKNPSCRIYADHYYCFVCQASGDAIDFLSQVKGISKGAAIKQLAERAGISLDGKPQTRAQVAYDREQQAFAEWWWKRECQRSALRTSAYVLMLDHGTTEIECEQVGLIARQMRGLNRQERVALCVRAATKEDRKEWEAERWWALTWPAAFESAMSAARTEGPTDTGH